jgi:hypothetical protein
MNTPSAVPPPALQAERTRSTTPTPNPGALSPPPTAAACPLRKGRHPRGHDETGFRAPARGSRPRGGGQRSRCEGGMGRAGWAAVGAACIAAVVAAQPDMHSARHGQHSLLAPAPVPTPDHAATSKTLTHIKPTPQIAASSRPQTALPPLASKAARPPTRSRTQPATAGPSASKLLPKTHVTAPRRVVPPAPPSPPSSSPSYCSPPLGPPAQRRT